ncbi:hypothetical protein AKJ56_01395 [candidate division MSBL1 archaeon SCGC-AAA382N08]|uniref:Uncharacterized protein n=1 Tax=candidate division MSBL1 archaeon SCGC-AAA382N08 TaxID=1698285 RepID=A0A133VPS0_9EURY|nr:hypothetical protein AKJ56_01395 [candidate division MSBL1 archaeon SCGC-AAA382N08]
MQQVELKNKKTKIAAEVNTELENQILELNRKINKSRNKGDLEITNLLLQTRKHLKKIKEDAPSPPSE